MQLEFDQTWILGERIDAGGFGQVFAVKSDAVESAVVKFVPKAPGAERELLFADLKDVRNVIPIIDQGETEDSWALVMPRAEKSLRQHLTEVGGPLDVADAVTVLTDIATALADLDGRVVHRDLKPANVLLLDSHWCLADFGISRYAEATTAPDTRKYAMSPPYAAPEQWRYERVTATTDVYAFGVIAYQLLAGSLPFTGPAEPDFRDQHLHQNPPQLVSVPAGLVTLVEECLYKSPQARPSAEDILKRLARAAEPPASTGLAKLQEANRANAIRHGEMARQESAHRSEAERRKTLSDDAARGLARIADVLKEAILQAATSASFSTGLDVGWTILFDQAELRLAPPVTASANPWGSWSAPPLEVIAFSAISLKIPPNRYGYEGRSHSLWYCDAQQVEKYQWFETAFMISPLIPRQSRQDPFALNPGEDSAKALWAGMAETQVAWPFTALTVDTLHEFISRWAGWFADAAQGNLNHPSTMPERSPQGSWRQR